VLNLSFGTDASQPAGLDPLMFAAEVAWRKGIVVVVSVGNDGSSLGRLQSPALDPFVIAVGADDTSGTQGASDDTVPSFSSVGDGVRNPDLVAPGVHVQSLRVPGSYIDQTYGSTGMINDRYFRGSGTSQAAAFTSGSVAALLSAKPGLTPDQAKWLLVNSAKWLPNAPAQAQGRGLINTVGAYNGSLPLTTAQNALPGTGAGTLEGARGSAHQILNGVTLTGELDIMGMPFAAAAMAGTELAGSSWAGGMWNGSSWAGSGWAGNSWAGSSWLGSSWAGSSWAGSSWASGVWTGSGWAGSSWAGSGWAGSGWASSGWAGSSWTGTAPTACPTDKGKSCQARAAHQHGFGQDDWK